MKWELMRPDAVKETLLFVPHYNFNWQIEYKFAQACIGAQRQPADCHGPL